jgi:hypothetical protein
LALRMQSTHRGEWSYGPTYSLPRWWVEVSGKLQVTAALAPGIETPVTFIRIFWGPAVCPYVLKRRQMSCLFWGLIHDSSVVPAMV